MSKRFFACAGTMQRNGFAAAMCAGSSRDTGPGLRRGDRIAWVQDVYPDELQRHRTGRRREGVHVPGDFQTAAEAQAVAREHISSGGA
jgi:hypothetical protein